MNRDVICARKLLGAHFGAGRNNDCFCRSDPDGFSVSLSIICTQAHTSLKADGESIHRPTRGDAGLCARSLALAPSLSLICLPSGPPWHGRKSLEPTGNWMPGTVATRDTGLLLGCAGVGLGKNREERPKGIDGVEVLQVSRPSVPSVPCQVLGPVACTRQMPLQGKLAPGPQLQSPKPGPTPTGLRAG